MFSKILIANRGEIACRIIRTARRLGVRTVAVYSDADAAALHVEMADEAFRIGPSTASESYLSIERILAAAERSGAQAIHPGYGFLSENAEFAEAVEAAGLVFIGPSPSAIRAMGLKDAAKALMEQSGVPVVPGYHGDNQDADFLAGQADEIGYPVLIKARAGGGGKGMRRVDQPADFAASLAAAQREGMAAFGDGAVLIEKYIMRPRHIEIQVFGDRHGNVVHLFERDCSLQRRHQKVIEEAPAPGMTAEMRRAMGDAAVRAARAIDYCGAGTVEFIVDVSSGLWPDKFFFMEMNTRLQVEHPVTEAITGVDLVEWQLRVASGEPLPMKQSDLSIEGWAFEARVYAEDPARGFLPSTGTPSHLAFPSNGVRVDSGVRQGDRVSTYYDPMIAKLIVHGPTRTAALAQLTAALDGSHIGGVANNLDFLSRLSRQQDFAFGYPDTGLIDREVENLTMAETPTDTVIALAAVFSLNALSTPEAGDPWTSLGHWQLWGQATRTTVLDRAGDHHVIRVAARGHDLFAVHVGGRVIPVRIGSRFEGDCHAEVEGRHTRVEVLERLHGLTLIVDGKTHDFHLPDPLDAIAAAEAGSDRLVAPMPGLIKLVRVREGDTVAKGDALIVMEAMKMELTLSATRDGIVESLNVAEGDQTSEGTVLLALKAEPA